MKFTIYGKGCSNCQLLTERVSQVADELGLEYQIEKVTDINAIVDAGVMHTPALAVDDELVLEGKVASTSQLKNLLTQ